MREREKERERILFILAKAHTIRGSASMRHTIWVRYSYDDGSSVLTAPLLTGIRPTTGGWGRVRGE